MDILTDEIATPELVERLIKKNNCNFQPIKIIWVPPSFEGDTEVVRSEVIEILKKHLNF